MIHSRTSESNGSDPRLQEIVAAYLDAVASGQIPERERLLEQHADLADELRAFFADHDRMTEAAAPLRGQLAVLDDGVAGAAAKPAHEEFPQSFSDYELLEEIGKGGMGVVYKARQMSLNRVVALKRIRAGHLASQEEVARFQREAKAAAGLDHPHIVPIYEVGECDGQQFFTMKLMEKGNLAANLDCYLADPKATARLLASISQAVHHAHQRGVLNRDLKPANILIDADGRPHVSDFGLAKRLEEEPRLTRSGAVLGTPEYMAPEQARGDREVTTAADVYGLGAVLYFLLTRQPPFRGNHDWGILKQVVEEDPTAPRAVNRHANRDLEIVCLKCLNKEPSRRYGSAADVAEDLERWLRGEPITARPTGRGERVVKWVKRRPAVTALAAATLFAVVLGFATTYTQYLEATEYANQARTEAAEKSNALAKETQALGTAQRETERAKDEAKLKEKALAEAKRESELKDEALGKSKEALAAVEAEKARVKEQFERTRDSLFSAQLMHASSLLGRDPGRAAALLFDYETCPIDRHDFAWRYAARLCDRRQWTVQGLNPRQAVFSPDGQLIAVAGDDQYSDRVETTRVTLLRASDGKVLATLPVAAYGITSLAFSPDGVILAVTARKYPSFGGKKPDDLVNFAWWDIPSGKARPPLKTTLNAGLVAFAPDGSLLLAGWLPEKETYHPALQQVDTTTGDARATTKILDAKGGPRAISKDGRKLLCYQENHDFSVHEVESGKNLMSARFGGKGAAISADGSLVAAGDDRYGYQGSLVIWEVAGGKQRHRFGPAGDVGHGTIEALAFLDACTLLSAASSIKFWDIRTGDLRGTHSISSALATSPDGNSLLTLGDGVTLRTVGRDGAFKTLTCKDSFGLVASPDGKTLAARDREDKLMLVDVATGKQRLLTTPERVPMDNINIRFLLGGEKVLAHRWLWNVADGKLEQTFDNVPAFSPDGKLFAVWNAKEEQWAFWNAATLKRSGAWPKAPNPVMIALGPDLKRLAIMSATHEEGTGETDTAEVYDRDSKELLATFKRTWPVTRGPRGMTQLLFAPDGQRLLMKGHRDVGVVLGDLTTRKQTVLEHGPSLYKAQFSPDGRFVLTISYEDNGVKLWNAADGALVRQFPGARPPVAFSPGGDLLVTLAEDHRSAKIWHTSSGQLRAELVGHDEMIHSLCFDPLGRFVASGSKDGTVRIWLGAPRSLHAAFPFHYFQSRASPDGQWLVCVGTPRGRYYSTPPPPPFRDRLNLFDLRTGQLVKPPFSSDTLETAFSPDGNFFAYAPAPRQVSIYDLRERRSVTVPYEKDHYLGEIRKIAFSPDSSLLLLATSQEMRLLEAATGKLVHVLPETPSGHGIGIAFSPDGAYLVGVNIRSNEAFRWDVKTGAVRAFAFEGTFGIRTQIHFSADGRRMLTFAEQPATTNIELWDSLTGKRIAVLAKSVDARQVQFSSDGKTVAAVVRQGPEKVTPGSWEVRLWDGVTGETLPAPKGHDGNIRYIAFRPDGAALALMGERGKRELWVWHVAKAEVERIALLPSTAPTDLRHVPAYWVAYSPDGKHLACSDDAGLLLLDGSTLKVRGKMPLRGHPHLFEGFTFLGNDRIFAPTSSWQEILDVRAALAAGALDKESE